MNWLRSHVITYVIIEKVMHIWRQLLLQLFKTALQCIQGPINQYSLSLQLINCPPHLFTFRIGEPINDPLLQGVPIYRIVVSISKNPTPLELS